MGTYSKKKMYIERKHYLNANKFFADLNASITIYQYFFPHFIHPYIQIESQNSNLNIDMSDFTPVWVRS